ncbi:MAG TPA: CAP domain-containing protein [Flavisolibacter sp.]|jgi:uncharacterized protein YkwD|nr:CAP domain-containing protein [Flavisolibacter sp.]
MKPFLFILPLFFTIFQNTTLPNLNDEGPEPWPVNKKLLLQLINQVRQKGCKCGDTYYPAAAPIAWNSKLEQAALVHSNDMYANNYFSHASKDGSKAGNRIDKMGYSWKTYGENIAFGYRTEKEVVKGWLLSPGHCKNIMSKTFKEMGVARVGDYWTQVFATK